MQVKKRSLQIATKICTNITPHCYDYSSDHKNLSNGNDILVHFILRIITNQDLLVITALNNISNLTANHSNYCFAHLEILLGLPQLLQILLSLLDFILYFLLT